MTTTSHPKFDDMIRSRLVDPCLDANAQPTYGMIVTYDSTHNTASVLVSGGGSDDMGQIYKDVLCPTTIGVQHVAPRPGTPVGIIFKNRSYNQPMVTHYFNHDYAKFNYTTQNRAVHTTPRFLLGM